MFSFLIRRSLMTIPIIIGVTIIVFLLMQASGDPIRLIYGANVPPERVAQLREDLGLDLPIYQQYLNWVGNLLRGDLGISIRTNIPVFTMITERIIPTLELTILALIITLVVSIPAGIISAVKRYSIFDHFSRVFALFWVSMPYFWLGIIFILIFSINLRWFPVSGRGGPVFSLNGFKHIILPSLTLGLPPAALFMRIIRSKMLEIINIFIFSLPLILGIANIMLANNICDIKDDRENDRYTLPIYLSRSSSLKLFSFFS